VAFGDAALDVVLGSAFVAAARVVRARVGRSPAGLGATSASSPFVVAALAATDSAAFRQAAGAGRPAPKFGIFPAGDGSKLPSIRA
jgi:hypothetical protein